MKILIDTHILIWHGENNVKLTAGALALLDDPANEVFVSHASLWEIAIKVGLGKLDIAVPIDQLETVIFQNGFDLLPFRAGHYLALSTLPFFHNDPFDRMLIAQAMSEGLALLTHDDKFKLYPVPLL